MGKWKKLLRVHLQARYTDYDFSCVFQLLKTWQLSPVHRRTPKPINFSPVNLYTQTKFCSPLLLNRTHLHTCLGTRHSRTSHLLPLFLVGPRGQLQAFELHLQRSCKKKKSGRVRVGGVKAGDLTLNSEKSSGTAGLTQVGGVQSDTPLPLQKRVWRRRAPGFGGGESGRRSALPSSRLSPLRPGIRD